MASSSSDLALLRRHGGALFTYRTLPAPARRSLANYFSEYADWSPDPRENDKRFGDSRWWYAELPMDVAIAEVWRRMQEEEGANDGWRSFEDYHRWYLGQGNTPKHRATNRWPVLLSGEPDQAFIWDGHHRFHSYVRSGHATLPVLLEVPRSEGSTNEARPARTQRVPVTAGALYLSRSVHRGYRADTDHVQDVVEGVKRGRPQAARQAAGWLVRSLRDFRGLIVPAPRSTADRPSLRVLAEALIAEGVDGVVAELLERATPVPSSRVLRRKGMHGVSAQMHRVSLRVTPPSSPEESRRPILVVDDVLTQGNMLSACVQALRQAGWTGSIRGAVAGLVTPADETRGRPAVRARIRTLEIVRI